MSRRPTVSEKRLSGYLQCFADRGITPAKVRVEPTGAVEFVLADGDSLTSEAELAELERQQDRIGEYAKRRKVSRPQAAGRRPVLLDASRQGR